MSKIFFLDLPIWLVLPPSYQGLVFTQAYLIVLSTISLFILPGQNLETNGI